MHSVQIGSDPLEMFRDIDVGVFIGGFPRKQGMERKDLLQMNGKIFREQGNALGLVAAKNVKVVVVANPANTNCYLLSHFAPEIPRENFSALTRLDQNRAMSQISQKTGVSVSQVTDVTIWGNHSATQVPDVRFALVKGEPCAQLVQDEEWLETEFVTKVQKRGAEIIAVKKTSSIFSAANALKDHLKDWYQGSDKTVSMAILTTGSPEEYGVPTELVFSFPVHCTGHWQRSIV